MTVKTTVTVIRDDADDLIVVAGTSPTSLKCACIHQAALLAARGQTSVVIEVTVLDRHGEPIPRADWPKCRVPRGEWEQRVHHWTHGATLIDGSGS